jgi:hypothetical protein
LLLITILVSLTALWVLARVRFADRSVTPNPIAPVLTQLAPPPVFDQLSSAMLQVQSRIAPLLLPVEVATTQGPSQYGTIAALKLNSDRAVALLVGSLVADDDVAPGVSVAAHDPATGLAVLRILQAGPLVPAPARWSPRQPQTPRYLVAGDVTAGGVSGRPVYIGPLSPVTSKAWSDVVWELPVESAVEAGTFVFTIDGTPAGLVATAAGRRALVQIDTVVSTAERLLLEGPQQYGRLGLEVQPMTASLAAATGAAAGVVVAWIDSDGPAAGTLQVLDVIVGVDGTPIAMEEDWHVIAARATVGQQFSLQIRRAHEMLTVDVTAAPPRPEPESRELGLTLRSVARVGAEVLTVASGSTAEEAGVRAGDVITVIGARKAPTAAQVRRGFAEAESADRPVPLAVTRGGTHLVLTLGN